MEKTKEFLMNNWKFLLVSLAVVAGFLFCYGEYKDYKNNQPVPQVIVNGITEKELDAKLNQLLPRLSQPQRTEITERIIETQVKEVPPQVVYITKTQEEADKTANTIAKNDKAEGLVKETEQKPDGTIENKYWGIHTEKDTKLKAGVTFGGYNSLDLGIQHKRLEVMYHKSIDTQKSDAITVMYTIYER